MPETMSEDAKQEILSNIRGAIAVITARGYRPDGWMTTDAVNVRRAVGLSAFNYQTHIDTLNAIGRRLPSGPRGKRFTGVTDWETIQTRTKEEVLDMLNGVIVTLEDES